MKINKLLIGVAISAILLAALAVPAFAGDEGDGSGYCTQAGCVQSLSQTECAGHGSFGAFGKGANLGIEASPGNGNVQHATFLGSWPGPGTDGSQTGDNNSQLCGNPQN